MWKDHVMIFQTYVAIFKKHFSCREIKGITDVLTRCSSPLIILFPSARRARASSQNINNRFFCFLFVGFIGLHSIRSLGFLMINNSPLSLVLGWYTAYFVIVLN